MKNLIIVLFLGLFAFGCNCGDNSSEKKASEMEANTMNLAKAENVQAYYFHFTRRCKTCQTVEEVTSETLKELYNGKVELQSINLDEEGESKELADEMEVKAQTLLLVVNGKKHDLTNEAFLNAVNAPETLKEKIIEAVQG